MATNSNDLRTWQLGAALASMVVFCLLVFFLLMFLFMLMFILVFILVFIFMMI